MTKAAAKERASGKGSVPIALMGLGLAVMLFAFSRGESPRDFSFEGIAFDLAPSASADPVQDGYSAARKSNHAYALVHADAGRFYALYGPTPAQLSGVLVGDAEERGGEFSSVNLHEFSVESGGLRVSAQEGRFAPARFVEAAAEAPAPISIGADRYEGQLSDATGTWPAVLTIAADGGLSIDSDTCHARGTAARSGTTTSTARTVEATFEAGCAHHGATLQGHAFRHGDALVVVLPSRDLNRGAVFSGTPVAR